MQIYTVSFFKVGSKGCNIFIRVYCEIAPPGDYMYVETGMAEQVEFMLVLLLLVRCLHWQGCYVKKNIRFRSQIDLWQHQSEKELLDSGPDC